MCYCAKPNVNGEPGAYSWDGKTSCTYPPNPPDLAERDVLLFDEPGRCGGLDCHSHHFRLVKNSGPELLVRHGGGDERFRVSLPRGFDFGAMDSNTRYWLFHAIYRAYADGRSAAAGETAREYNAAFAEGRLKKRKLPGRNQYRIWIDRSVRPAESEEAR
jgi:hypothetical protein